MGVGIEYLLNAFSLYFFIRKCRPRNKEKNANNPLFYQNTSKISQNKHLQNKILAFLSFYHCPKIQS
jgi:hypothetical protein